MGHAVTIKYTKALVRQALNHFMLKRLGRLFFVALAAGILVLAASFFSDLWNWFMSVVAVVILSAVTFVIFVYFARLRAAEDFFECEGNFTHGGAGFDGFYGQFQ